MNGQTTVLAVIAAVLGGGCAATGVGSGDQAGPELGVAPPAASGIDGVSRFFEVQEQEELFFQVTSVGSWATVSAAYGGWPSVSRDQRLQFSGTVTDPTGTKMFAIARVELDELRDEQGHDLMKTGQVSLSPSPRSPSYFSPPSPGSGRSVGFSASVQGLPSLPPVLSAVRGRLVVEAPGASKVFDLAPLIGEGQVELAPGLLARVRTYPGHNQSMLAAQVEYVLTRPKGTGAGVWAPPMVVGLSVYDQNGEAIFQAQRGQEHFSKNKVVGVIPMNYGLGDRRAVRWELEVAVDTREIVFGFEGRDVSLAGAGS